MASRGPARAANHVVTVIETAVHDLHAAGLVLEMALVAETRAARFEHLVVHRAVGRMTRHAALAHRLVLEGEARRLRRVALRAGRIRGGDQRFRAAERIGVAPVRLVTARAGDLAREHGVRVRQAEFGGAVVI